MFSKIMALFMASFLFSVFSAAFACPQADLSGDCFVGLNDLAILAEQWLDPAGCAGHPADCADMIGNDGVDGRDFALLAMKWYQGQSPVVINEIHYNPDISTELIEFIELYNKSNEAVDVSGWRFCDGLAYTFPPGTMITANGYLVITEDSTLAVSPTTVTGKYGTSISIVYGPFVGGLRNDGEKIELCDAEGIEIDQVSYQLGFPWPTVGDAAPDSSPGTGHSIQLLNEDIDNDLGGSWRSAYPTPGALNSTVYAANIPPQIRQVKHAPKAPISTDTVTITAKVTDPGGVASVTLLYQIVEPGAYLPAYIAWSLSELVADPYRPPLENPAFEDSANWTEVAMTDDGGNGDQFVGDSIFTIVLPVERQVHRRLIRYRIRVSDPNGASVRVPYADDPGLNFAYYCYDGEPAWSGAIQPGAGGAEGQVVTYGTDIMRSMPTYQLLSLNSEVEDCQWNAEAYNIGFTTNPGHDIYNWHGAMIYDGEVYDHIRYRVRGWSHPYGEGKNKWKFDFNRGRYFEARDGYGKKYPKAWDKINFLTGYSHRVGGGHPGEEGMIVAANYHLYNLVGVPAPNTHFVQFRVVDDAVETHPTDQYEGDFWGLYLATEQADGRFLDSHGLPDGNLYKMNGAGTSLNNQGPTQPSDWSDKSTMESALNSGPSEAWFHANTEQPAYYGYRAICEAVHHFDISATSNHLMYHNPLTDKWWMLPWDVDLSWSSSIYGNDTERFKQCLNYADINIAYKNRAREIRDLLFNADQGGVLIDELASYIDRADTSLAFVDADRALWDYHPRGKDDGKYFDYESGGTFDGVVARMKTWMDTGWGGARLDSISADSSIPDAPDISYIGDSNYPVNDLHFQTSSFSPQGAGTFSAMKWRIAEVEPSSVVVDPGTVELIPEEAIWLYFEGTDENGEPSAIQGQWRQLGFDDNSWNEGQTAIGYGENFINKTLNMQGNYTTIYLRKSFNVANKNDIESLSLDLKYDDGVNVWINGTYVANANVQSQELAYDATADGSIENTSFVNFELTNPSAYLNNGTNIIAIQVLNWSISSSSDCFVDVRLSAILADQVPEPIEPATSNKRLKYEIDAVWESDELTVFNDTIQVPASNLKAGRTYRVRCRMKDTTGRWSHWSDPNQFIATEPLAAHILDNLRVTELMFNPTDADISKGELDTDNDDFEFIELKNTGSFVLDLSSLSFIDGVTFDFSTGSVPTLSPGEFVLVIKDPNAFESRYGTSLTSKIAGEFTAGSSLSNSGENVTLVDTWNGTVVNFTYNDSRGWPLAADGAGHSMIPLDTAIEDEPYGTLEYGGNWRQSGYINGSPGQDDPLTPAVTAVINELMAHTDYLVSPHVSNDWIELYNADTSTINLNGDWYLSDDADDLKKYALPTSALSSGGHISYDQVNHFNPDGTGPDGWGLNKAGDTLFLSYLPGTTADRVVDCIEFKGQENFISLGRYPDGDDYYFAMPPSRDSENMMPNARIVISEVMYHPLEDTTNEEYIELYNPTGQPVNMWTTAGAYALDGGVNYIFPASITIANGSRILIVGFDPVLETARLSDFETTYGTGSLTANVNIFGPWTGSLANSGERVTLEKPQEPDLPDPDMSWIIVDEIIYGDYWPWPTDPDGTGSVLQRIFSDPDKSGNDSNNWEVAIPTPGT